MDLKKLRHAVILAKEGTFAKASVSLRLSQPALSRSIQSLEQELDMLLFDRHPSGIAVTKCGQRILAKAETLLRDANGLKREAELLKNAEIGNLAFGMGPVPSQSMLPKIMGKVMAQVPEANILVDTQRREQLLPALLDETLEFFVATTYQLEARSDLAIQPLAPLKMGFFVHPQHPLCGKKISGIQKLYQFPLATHSLVQGQRRNLHQAETELTEWPGKLICESIDVLKSAALEANSILLTNRDIIEDELATGELVPLKSTLFNDPNPALFGVVSLANRSLSPLALLVIEAIKDQVQYLSQL